MLLNGHMHGTHEHLAAIALKLTDVIPTHVGILLHNFITDMFYELGFQIAEAFRKLAIRANKKLQTASERLTH